MIISDTEKPGDKTGIVDYRPHLSISIFSSGMKCA
jgi:hypothetical protein